MVEKMKTEVDRLFLVWKMKKSNFSKIYRWNYQGTDSLLLDRFEFSKLNSLIAGAIKKQFSRRKLLWANFLNLNIIIDIFWKIGNGQVVENFFPE